MEQLHYVQEGAAATEAVQTYMERLRTRARNFQAEDAKLKQRN
jgi:hypothetical protein